MSGSRAPLFTPRFFVMCGFTFTVFLSAFQLLPTVPFRILDLGGSTFAAGLFLGFLTYASALSAPVTGALGDRIGRRRVMLGASVLIVLLAAAYGASSSWRGLLALALLHGVVWSGLLSASSAYATELIPPGRRAEGIGYWGLSSVFAVASAPALGLWVYRHGWIWLCLSIGMLNIVMAVTAFFLPDDRPTARASGAGRGTPLLRPRLAELLEWRVVLMALTLFLYSFGYGGVTSFVAIYGEANGLSPRGLYFTLFALAIVATRPFVGRLADRIGHTRVLVPCLALVACGYFLLAMARSPSWFVVSALVFGCGFGSAYPVFVAHILRLVPDARRGAAFGGILAAFDTGIGTGSMAIGWMGQRVGFAGAYGVAAGVAVLAIPYFLVVEPRLRRRMPLGADDLRESPTSVDSSIGAPDSLSR